MLLKGLIWWQNCDIEGTVLMSLYIFWSSNLMYFQMKEQCDNEYIFRWSKWILSFLFPQSLLVFGDFAVNGDGLLVIVTEKRVTSTEWKEEEEVRPANAPLVKISAAELQISPETSARRCNSKGRGSVYNPILGICCHFCRFHCLSLFLLKTRY